MPRAARPTPYVNDPANIEMRRIREAMGLTKVDFSRLLGYEYCHLYNLETGRAPVMPTILRLARYLARDPELVSVPPPVPPPDPASCGLILTPASYCDWHEPHCRGPWWHVKASLNRLTHVECTTCDYHLKIVYDLVVQRLRARQEPKVKHGSVGRPRRVWPPDVRAEQDAAASS